MSNTECTCPNEYDEFIEKLKREHPEIIFKFFDPVRNEIDLKDQPLTTPITYPSENTIYLHD